MRWVGHAAHRKDKKCIKILDGKLSGKTQCGRPRRRWENLLKLILNKWHGDVQAGFI
jgi:hypothetical protein